MKWKPYPKYKPSGVEWLGEVPEHWSLDRIKRASLRVTDGAHISPDISSPDFPFVSTVDLDGGKIDFDGCLRTSNESYSYLVRTGCKPYQGDLLFSKDGTVGRTAVIESDQNFVVASSLVIISPKPTRLNVKYLDYWLNNSLLQQDILLQMSGAAIRRISIEKISKLPLWLPPPPEQTAIAAFLDRETGRIDELVGKKRELIERLKEKRSALISRTVTRGLPADLPPDTLAKLEKIAGEKLPLNPPLKPSGIDWLGDVPVHWQLRPVKHVARIGNGSTPSRENAAYWEDGDFPWINSSSVNRETITDSQDFVTPLALRECHLPKVKPPAVLIGITGQGRTRGMASTLLFEATINQHVAYVKPTPGKADAFFLRRVFDMAYGFLRSESDGGGSTKGAITCEQIGTMSIPLPPIPEQAAIAAYLDEETAKLDALVTKVETAIERLQEYRSALITAAVTGKMDVRAAAADGQTISYPETEPELRWVAEESLNGV
ncbi:MAG: restriction endonuclease subunit S [Verrucomicrobia bacterium]|nr:restriction endonuclease subunit S [Verrucomicrobiota bacterium]MCH8526399.1 restriction endonuclease subunit S [Kiritimatiellia bacterium]